MDMTGSFSVQDVEWWSDLPDTPEGPYGKDKERRNAIADPERGYSLYK
jgi:hypothetical protein